MNDEGQENTNGFHIYEPVDQGTPWKWCIAFATDDVTRMVHIGDWCLETFGEPADNMYYITDKDCWYNVIPYGEIYLKSDKELLLFDLKWLTPDH